MLNDLTLIVHKLSKEYPYINIYPFGDKHIGSKEFDLKRFRNSIQAVKNDPFGFAIICGDMLDFGLKNSKTNVYQQVLMPHEQKELLCDEWIISDKTLAIVPGNHCERGVRETGINPLYDFACRLRIEDVYRENLAILKINLGERKDKQRQISYGGIVSHGTSTNKHHKYVQCFDGIDFAFSGHTHTPSYTPRGKIRIDLKNSTATKVGYKEIVVDSSLDTGGYALKGEYEISAPPETQILKLYGNKKRMAFISEDI